METPLFRKEALDARARAHQGRPAADLPKAWTAMTLALLLLAGAIGAFLVFGEMTRKETVRGRLVPTLREARVFVPEPGVAGDIQVQEGDRVQAGDPLVLVRTDRAMLGGAVVSDAILSALATEARALEDQLTRLDQQYDLREAEQRNALTQIDLDMAAYGRRRESVLQRLAIAEERLEAAEQLAEQGWTPAEEVRRREEVVLSIEEQLDELDTANARRGEERESTQLSLRRLSLDREDRRAELNAALSRLQQQRVDAGYREGFLTRAPISGTITALQVSEGDRVAPDRPLMVIAPEGAQLEAEVFIPSRAIGFVAEGEAVRIMFDAFPYQRFGFADGEVRSITDTVLTPQEADPALQLQEPVYRAYVALDAQEISAYGGEHSLQTGMALQADIVLEKRSVLAWVMEPVISMRGRL